MMTTMTDTEHDEPGTDADGAEGGPTESARAELPPDPVAYDAPRNARARAKGLDAPYIAGGDDPDIASARVEERRLLRWLVIMVVVIIASGFVIGTALAIAGAGR
jgi:hypothetical protein